MICSTDPSKFESSKLLETVVSLLKKKNVYFHHDPNSATTNEIVPEKY